MADRDQALRSATCYSRLDASVAQFRTVTLLPGEWLDPVQCQLSVHSLDNAPPFTTISYAWGDPSDTKEIIVDGIELAIPSSLELCLRFLRSSESALTDLWADAICIDQMNMPEKVHQVSNMGAIYWRCSSMFIWLGVPSPSSQSRNPFEMVMHWAEDKHFYQYPGFSLSKETGGWVFHDNPAYQQMYELFADLVSRPWWARLWCVQEIALCPVATIVLGDWRLPWATILAALNNYSCHASNCCSGVSGILPAKYTYDSDHLLFLPQQADFTNVDQVLRAFRHKLCKDPRDKIYGLLGLLWKNRNLNLRPDYSLPVGKVYLQATEAIVSQSEGDLQFLTGRGLSSDDYQLPSWVRNFAAPLTTVEASYEHSRYKRYKCYHASAEAKSCLQVLDNTTLSLTGVFHDRIDRVGMPIQSRDWTHIWTAIQEWAEIAKLPILDLNDGHGLLQDRFWRTVVADVLPTNSINNTWDRISISTEVPVSAWFADTIDFLRQGLEPPTTSSVHALWAATCGRAFFRTKSGHFGLCFPNVSPGDEVWVLAGGKVPFMLRRFDDAAKSAEGGEFGLQKLKLVGECYLHGFMDGEALRNQDDVLVSVHLK